MLLYLSLELRGLVLGLACSHMLSMIITGLSCQPQLTPISEQCASVPYGPGFKCPLSGHGELGSVSTLDMIE